MRGQRWRGFGERGEVLPRGPGARESSILGADPSHQVGIDTREMAIQPGPVEPAVVLHPAGHDRIDRRGQLLEGVVVVPAVQPPVADYAVDTFQGVGADRGQKRQELTSVPVSGGPGTERVAQERERRAREGAPPVVVLAVHDLRLVRVQHETDLFHACCQRGEDFLGTLAARAVHDRVVGVPFELDIVELSDQPHVERVMQEQIRDHRRYRRTLGGSPVPLDHRAVGHLDLRGKPPPQIQHDPRLVGVCRHRLEHQIPGHTVEELGHVKIYPDLRHVAGVGSSPATLNSFCRRRHLWIGCWGYCMAWFFVNAADQNGV